MGRIFTSSPATLKFNAMDEQKSRFHPIDTMDKDSFNQY